MHLVGCNQVIYQHAFYIGGMLQGCGAICMIMLLITKGSLAHMPIIWETESFSLIKIITGIFSIGVFFGWFGSISAVRKFLV